MNTHQRSIHPDNSGPFDLENAPNDISLLLKIVDKTVEDAK